jgi:uncharacterized protein (TIGR00369 family)
MTEAKDPKSSGESEATMTELMMPNMANNHGNVFGGVILSLVDRVAAVAAIRHARLPCVTISFDKVDFLEPIHLGELVIARSKVNFVGRTSMEVGVRVEAENLVTGKRRHTNTCYVTYVAIDDAGRPVPVPPLEADNDDDRRRMDAGRKRRALRIAEEKSENG